MLEHRKVWNLKKKANGCKAMLVSVYEIERSAVQKGFM